MTSYLPRRSALKISLTLALMALSFAPVLAQTYPDHPVKLTLGFAPGTGPDVLARTMGQQLGENLKQPLIIDNRSGAGGQIAAQVIAKSIPDGYSVLLADVGSISIAPAAFSKLSYDPEKELVVVSEVARTDFILVVPMTSPARTVADFVKAAQANSARVNFATFGAGTPGHFGAEMLAELGHFKVEPIHYRATGDAVTAIVAGDVQAALVSTALAMAQIKGGKMRGIATTALKRTPLLPDVPTFTEAGYPKADFSSWFGLFVPVGTPAAVMATLNAQVVEAVKSPAVKKRLEEAGFSIVGSTQADARVMVAAEAMRWAQVVKASGFKGD